MSTIAGSATGTSTSTSTSTSTIPLAVSLAPLSAGHVTSAIPDMTVANIRKGLASLREKWKHRSSVNPLFISDKLIAGMSIEQFCMRFVLGQHMKRHAKSSLHRASAAALAAAALHTSEITALALAVVPPLPESSHTSSSELTIALAKTDIGIVEPDVVTVSGPGRTDTQYVLTRAQV